MKLSEETYDWIMGAYQEENKDLSRDVNELEEDFREGDATKKELREMLSAFNKNEKHWAIIRRMVDQDDYLQIQPFKKATANQQNFIINTLDEWKGVQGVAGKEMRKLLSLLRKVRK